MTGISNPFSVLLDSIAYRSSNLTGKSPISLKSKGSTGDDGDCCGDDGITTGMD